MTQVVGRPTPRIEGKLKVTGRGLYGADLNLPGVVWDKGDIEAGFKQADVIVANTFTTDVS